MSTRMIGGLIMTHGDDDGLRVPPQIAPWQVVILPMLRGDEGDGALLEYCDLLKHTAAQEWAFDEKVRVLLDSRPGKVATKRWDWVRRGAPIIIEVGPRDMEHGRVSLLRRDRLWNDAGKPDFASPQRDEATVSLPELLADIQSSMFAEAAGRRDSKIERGITGFDQLAAFFAEDKRYPGWAEVQWARPTAAELEQVIERLKALKLTFRNVPLDAAPADGTCIFTGAPAVERILVARAY